MAETIAEKRRLLLVGLGASLPALALIVGMVVAIGAVDSTPPSWVNAVAVVLAVLIIAATSRIAWKLASRSSP